jgi:hypothetical protein
MPALPASPTLQITLHSECFNLFSAITHLFYENQSGSERRPPYPTLPPTQLSFTSLLYLPWYTKHFLLFSSTRLLSVLVFYPGGEMSDETDGKRELRRARRRAKHLILSRRHLPREGFSYGLGVLTFQSPQDSKDLMRAMMKASGARTYILPVHRDNRLE